MKIKALVQIDGYAQKKYKHLSIWNWRNRDVGSSLASNCLPPTLRRCVEPFKQTPFPPSLFYYHPLSFLTFFKSKGGYLQGLQIVQGKCALYFNSIPHEFFEVPLYRAELTPKWREKGVLRTKGKKLIFYSSSWSSTYPVKLEDFLGSLTSPEYFQTRPTRKSQTRYLKYRTVKNVQLSKSGAIL